MSKQNSFNQAYTDRQAGRSLLRKAVRRIFIRKNVRHAIGKTLDFGCGTGELLRHLPEGSVGLDINPASVAYCKAHGLDARVYDPDTDRYDFLDYTDEGFQTFLLCHVLEHIPAPLATFRRILDACSRMGVVRVLLIAPGRKGFLSDPTHDTRIDMELLRSGNLESYANYTISDVSYFPINTRRGGDYLVYNELNIVYTRTPSHNTTPPTSQRVQT